MTTRVSVEAALEILRSRPDIRKEVVQHWAGAGMGILLPACRQIRTMKIDKYSYVLVCGEPIRHKGRHEDIAGGVWWVKD